VGESTIKSQLPGVFYRQANPKADPYVNEGDHVRAGDVVGLLEIMKTFYEVKSDREGVVARFLVENEALVEAGDDVVLLAESG
jgi:acetyl-CoA carboxylase biotin carboxyl carrier protein